MQHDEMIGKVQDLAQLPDRGSAEQATRAVLETLAERLPSALGDHIAAQLPPALATAMRQVTQEPAADGDPATSGERFGLTAFTGRIAGRAATDDDSAVQQAAAVLEVLDAALTPELTDKMAGALPADIRELLPAGRSTDGTD
ncbi:DUF2267 domain-containing protein [Streptomyces sp. NPDC058794]